MKKEIHKVSKTVLLDFTEKFDFLYRFPAHNDLEGTNLEDKRRAATRCTSTSTRIIILSEGGGCA